MTYIFGDVHGCWENLNTLIEKNNIGFTKENKYIFVGDFFDRGSESAEVYLFIKDLKKKLGDSIVLIYGNHEQMLLDYYADVNEWWLHNGYQATLESFVKNGIDIKDVIDFIKNNFVYYYEEESFCVCHAGRYENELGMETIDRLIWDRDSVTYSLYAGKLTFVGHTPYNTVPKLANPLNDSSIYYDYNAWYDLPSYGLLDIDTGCVYGEPGCKLTAVQIDKNRMKFLFDN